MFEAIMGIVPMIYESITRLLEVDQKLDQLGNVVNQVASRVEDLNTLANNEEQRPGKKRKRVVDAHIRQAARYRESAQFVLNSCEEEQGVVKRMKWVPSIERHHREGQELLSQGSLLIEQGLTYDVVRTRGQKLPLEENQYMGSTARRHLESAFRAMIDGSAPCIGIYGQAWAGKTNLMKHLYNKVFEDGVNFKAVFWATAPEPANDQSEYHKALQNCVADGMWVDLDDGVVHDEVRSAAQLTARLQEIGPGRVVFFLDNVKRDFQAYELLGIPSLVTPNSTTSATTAAAATTNDSDANLTKCILVFTTRSQDICNWMQCDLPLRMDLLEKEEAQELFLHEVRFAADNMENGRVLSNREREIQEIAVQVADQCARMPLAIIIIARSMAQIVDLHEWRNRLNELIGNIRTIHIEDEEQILRSLKFGYDNLTDGTVKSCFLGASRMLEGDREVSKVDIIERWKMNGLIGTDRPDESANDQGHTILNQLERRCLLQLAPDNSVTMNKWICRMAARVSR